MKATLEFDLDDPEDRRNHWLAINGYKAFMVINYFDGDLRKKIKYSSEDDYSDVEINLMETIRIQLRGYLDEEGIPFSQFEGL